MKTKYLDITFSKYGFELDHGDLWGSVMDVFFGVASELYRREKAIPDTWGFSPGAGGCSLEGTYNEEIIQGLSDSELVKLGNILNYAADDMKNRDMNY